MWPFEGIWNWSRTLIEWNKIFDYFYYLQLADTVKYIVISIIICTIKEQYSDKGNHTWVYDDLQNSVGDVQFEIQWLHNVDMPVAKWASAERQ